MCDFQSCTALPKMYEQLSLNYGLTYIMTRYRLKSWTAQSDVQLYAMQVTWLQYILFQQGEPGPCWKHGEYCKWACFDFKLTHYFCLSWQIFISKMKITARPIWLVKTSWFGMFRHPAWASVGYRSGPLPELPELCDLVRKNHLSHQQEVFNLA